MPERNFCLRRVSLRDPRDPKTKTYWEDWFKNDPNAVSISFAGNALIKWNGSDNQAVGVLNCVAGRDIVGQPTRNNPGGFNGAWYSGPSVISQTNVNRVAETIMMTGRYNGNNYFGGSSIISGNTGWDYTGPQAMPDPRRDRKPYTVTAHGATETVNKDNRFGAVAMYGEQGLFVFTDGHAKTMNPLATVPPNGFDNDNSKDEKNMWNAQRG